jgi:hypothetical protein
MSADATAAVARLVRWWCRVLLLVIAMPVAAGAHPLDIDSAALIELGNGTYDLAVQIPPALAPLIAPPLLPDHCAIVGNPGGQRGPYGIRFRFDCHGTLSASDALILPWRREGVMLTVTWSGGERASRLIMRRGVTIEVELAAFRAGSGSWRSAAQRFTALGIKHILFGIDHLLFVLGLMLVVQGFRALTMAITAFTAAHSLTLALATLGVVDVPPGPVEASIALSIVFLAAEIVHARQGRRSLTHRAPWLVAFGFGLLHGFGFAGALSEVGLPHAEIPLALLFFNLGVEIGQLAFVLTILALRQTMRRAISLAPGWANLAPAYVIGTAAMFWLIERTGAMLGHG